MIEEHRAEQWEKDAAIALKKHYDVDNAVANLAAVVLVLLQDRRERESYIQRLHPESAS